MKNTVLFYNNRGVRSAKVLVEQLSFIILIYFLNNTLDTSVGKDKARVQAPTHQAALPEDHSEGNPDRLKAHFTRNCTCQGKILFAFHSKANEQTRSRLETSFP